MDVLNGLTEEIDKRRYRGQAVLPESVGLQFFRRLRRCSVTRSLSPEWKLIVKPNAMREEVYHAQICTWDGYKSRAFAVLATVAENHM